MPTTSVLPSRSCCLVIATLMTSPPLPSSSSKYADGTVIDGDSVYWWDKAVFRAQLP
ncbi:unnamed protein product, partial [Mycena citricolor]